MAEIKEEIIEINFDKQYINSYCVIVERAQHTLSDIIKTWLDPALRSKKQEKFSPEKLAYYFY